MLEQLLFEVIEWRGLDRRDSCTEQSNEGECGGMVGAMRHCLIGKDFMKNIRSKNWQLGWLQKLGMKVDHQRDGLSISETARQFNWSCQRLEHWLEG